MRHRRRKNPLLAKTVGAGVIVAMLILPVLAKLGLFKQMHEQYVQTQLINLPAPPPQPKEQKAKVKKAAHPHVEEHHGPRITRATVQVHVQAGTASKGAGDTNNQIVNAAAGGPIGQVPTGPSSGTITGGPSGQPVQAPVIVSAPAIEPPITPPVVTPPPVPKSDVVVEAEPTYQPEPVIPDNLLDSDIDTTFYAYFTVQPDGSIDVKMVQGTGNSILDRLAMDAARQWKFAPATKNGVPVLSYRRLQVQFVVS